MCYEIVKNFLCDQQNRKRNIAQKYNRNQSEQIFLWLKPYNVCRKKYKKVCYICNLTPQFYISELILANVTHFNRNYFPYKVKDKNHGQNIQFAYNLL